MPTNLQDMPDPKVRQLVQDALTGAHALAKLVYDCPSTEFIVVAWGNNAEAEKLAISASSKIGDKEIIARLAEAAEHVKQATDIRRN